LADSSEQNETARIEAFSDGVFAIAITLLIIEITVPHLDGGESLGSALRDEWASYFAYVLSFIAIGIYWANHHSFFKLFHHADHWFLILNVVFLMMIAFLPFPTAVLAEYLQNDGERQTAIAFYTFGLLLPAAVWFALWGYGNWRGLVVHDLDPRYRRFVTRQYGASIAIYSAAFAISFANEWVALAICTGLTGLYLLPPRRPVFVDDG
jgi:uncharacterized membrane protein